MKKSCFNKDFFKLEKQANVQIYCLPERELTTVMSILLKNEWWSFKFIKNPLKSKYTTYTGIPTKDDTVKTT